MEALEKELKKDPTMGDPLGKHCYKVRMAITSKGQGKSGGARIITYIRVLKNTVYLMDIYDKSEQESISDREILKAINKLAE